MAKSIMQEEKECYITHDTLNLNKHHIYGGPYRKKSEKYGCWCWLRADWHNMKAVGLLSKKEYEVYEPDKYTVQFMRADYWIEVGGKILMLVEIHEPLEKGHE